MSIRRVLWPMGGLLALSSVALLIPQSPLYFPELLASRARYGGKSTAFWVDALKSPDEKVRRQATFAVGAIGHEASAAVPLLARTLVEDPDREFRNEAALALTKMAPASKAAVAELTRALEDIEAPIRMNACIALFKLDHDARPAITALMKVIVDDSNKTNVKTFQFTIQEIAIMALGRASKDTDEGVPLLLKMLETATTPELRIASARGLGYVGPPARPAEAEISKLLKDPNSPIREVAQEALASIGVPVVKDKE